MREYWFRPDVGYVLEGDVREIGDWLTEMQCKPALIIADPPYGGIVTHNWDVANVSLWLDVLNDLESFDCPIYWWGGIGKPGNRPFLEFWLHLEKRTAWRVRDCITWRKKRAYGKPKDYLFVREECMLLTVGGREPDVFHIPLSDEKRGYSGYNAKYPAKSEYKRITNVWDDTELLRGKCHPTQKAPAVIRRPIEVHTKPGDLVLDLFAGSGETSVQAKDLGRTFIAVERNREYCGLIADRLEGKTPTVQMSDVEVIG